MRRSEFQVTELSKLEPILQELEYLTLSYLGLQGNPEQRPLNFVWHDHAFWMHSSPGGAKIKALRKNPRVSASLTLPLSFIPSYATGSEDPCSASQFFCSILVEGDILFVEDPELKLEALSAMMRRFQPENRHSPMTLQDPKFQDSLAQTKVLKLEPMSMVGKFKLGQNLSASAREQLIAHLCGTQTETSSKTLSGMEAFRPESKL